MPLGSPRTFWYTQVISRKKFFGEFCSAPRSQSETPFKSVKFHKKKFPWNDLGMPKCPGGPQGHPYQVIWSYLKNCGFCAQIPVLCKSEGGPFKKIKPHPKKKTVKIGRIYQFFSFLRYKTDLNRKNYSAKVSVFRIAGLRSAEMAKKMKLVSRLLQGVRFNLFIWGMC